MTQGEAGGGQAPAPGARRRRWLRRALLGSLGGVGVLVLLHTPPAKAPVRSLVVRALAGATGADVAVERLDYRLWAGQVSAEGLSLRQPRLAITCSRLEADLGVSGVRVSLEEPRLVVEQGPETETAGPPSAPSRPWAVVGRFASIFVSRGGLELRDRQGELWLRIEDIDARVERDERGNGRSRGTARLGRVDVGWPGGGVRVAGIRAAAEVGIEPGNDALELVRSRLSVGGTELDVSGRLEQIGPIVTRAEGKGRIDAGILEQIAPALELEGGLDARLSFTHDAAGGRGSLAVDTDDLVAFGVGPWAGGVRGRLEGRRLVVESLDLRGYEGRASASGALFLWDGPSALEAQARGLDVAALARSIAGYRPPVASRADADLRLEIQSWDTGTLHGTGRVSLREGPGPGRGLPVSGPVRVDLSGERVAFEADDVRARGARLEIAGSLAFSKDLALRYALRLPDLAVAPALVADVGVATPSLALAGALDVEGELAGRLPDWELGARVSGTGLGVEELDLDLEGALTLTRAGIHVESLTARGPDGRIDAVGFAPFGPTGGWDARVDVAELRLGDALARRGVSVPAAARGVVRLAGPAADPQVVFELEGRVDAVSPDVSITHGGSLVARPDRAPRDDGSVAATGAPIETAEDSVKSMAEEPVRSERLGATLRASGSLNRHGLALESVAGELGGGKLGGSGRWTRDGGTLDVQATAEGIALQALPWLPDSLAGVDSTFAGDVTLSGTTSAPAGRATLALSGNAFRGSALPDARLDATADGREVLLAGRVGERELATGRLTLVGPWTLHLDVDLAAVPLTEALDGLPALARVEAALSLDGRLSVDVPVGSWRDLRYEARVDRLEGRVARAWEAGPFTVRGDAHGFGVEGLRLRASGSRLAVEGRAGFDTEPDVPLTLHGDVPLSDLALLLGDAELAGTAGFDVQVAGTMSDPHVDGGLHVVAGPGRLGQLRWEDGRIEARLDRGTLQLTTARATLLGGEASASGSVPLGPRAEGRLHELRIEATGIDLGRLRPADDGGTGVSALVDLSARLSAARPALDAVEGEGRLTRLAVSSGAMSMELASAVSWQLRGGTLTHSPLRLRGLGGGTLEVSGTLEAGGPSPRFRLALTGEADLAGLQPFLSGAARLRGPAHLDLEVERGPEGLALSGEARVEGGRVVLREPPLALDRVTGTLRATGRRIELVDVQGKVGDGQLIAAGHVDLDPSGPALELALRAEGVPLRYPEGLRSRSSGEVRLSGRGGRYRLEGDVVVHRATYEKEVDPTSRSLERVGAELQALDARGSPLEKVQLAIRVRLEEGLRIESDEARLVVEGAVDVGGDLLSPEVRGSLVLREGGIVRISRASLRITQGRIELAGFPTRSPELDIQGRTQVTGVLIEAGLTGPLDNFRLDLSAPNRSDLTQGDLATLILTGRTASAAASESGAIVAEELAAALGEALDQRLGGAVFIDVSRDESLVVMDTNPSQRFNIGVPVGKRTYVIYSQALDRNAPRWIVDFRPAGQFRLRLISDSDGSEAIEVSHRFSFNLWSKRSSARVATSRPPRVGRVLLEGVSPSEEATLRRGLKLKPGDEFDYFQADKVARKLHEALRQQGYRAALVGFTDRAAGPEHVDVVFEIDRGPRLFVEWRGDDPGRKAKRRVEGWDGDLPIEETAGRLGDELRRALQAGRHFLATVDVEVSRTGDDVRVVFDVQRGPPGKAVDLRFEGNASLPAETLRAALPATDEAAFFRLLEEAGRTRLVSAVRLAYAREGYLQATVGAPRRSFDAGTGVLRVSVPIEEGNRARVLALDLPEDARSPSDATPPGLETTVGEPFRVGDYVDDRARLASWYRERGYPEVRVAGLLEPTEGGLAVRFAVDPGPRTRVGTVRLAREGRTRPSVVADAVTLGPGDLVRPAELARSREQLSETGVFRSVDVRPEPSDRGEGVRDLVVDLNPRNDLALEYSVRYTTTGSGEVGGAPSSAKGGQVQFGAAVEASNPLGFAHKYRLYGLLGGDRALLGATFDAASFFGRRWRTQVFLFDDQDRLADIPRLLGRVRGATFQQTKRWRSGLTGQRWHDRLRMQWGYTFKHVRYTDPDTEGTLFGDRAGLIHSLIGDTRDSLTDPHRGLFWSVGTDLALRALGSEVDYVKLFGQLYVYLPLGAHVTWAQGYRVGVTPGENPLLLLEGRFQAGGATSVRGFGENRLGPQTAQGEPLGGQALAIFNQELRFPLWKRLWGGVFYDAGNVFALARDLRLGSLRHSAGAGLRLMFPFGPVRLDHAWVLDPQEGESRSRWVFSIGHAF